MSSPCRRLERLAAAALAAALLAGCQRETRDFHGPPPPSGPQASGVSPSDLAAGGGPIGPPHDPRAAIYEDNAFHIGEGKRYYDWYNCYGCHAAGGGDIGPPLMDDQWIYGGSIEQIHASIVEGRPNGMPSFRNKIPDDQVWEIAAYIRSMGGNVAKDAAPSRGDELQSSLAKTQVKPTPAKPAAPTDQPR
ncbi:MAG: cytochrome c [Caulobacterales bacterium]|nr:cytochrome c [Caulobacterales bacterium]